VKRCLRHRVLLSRVDMRPAPPSSALASAFAVAVFLTVVVGKFGRTSSTPVLQPGTWPIPILSCAYVMCVRLGSKRVSSVAHPYCVDLYYSNIHYNTACTHVYTYYNIYIISITIECSDLVSTNT
jgi:hypothetical protein